ncbi:MAG: hypothetical protein ABSB79_07020 [Syntrophales bacterium]|jgi:acetyltransferase-like isoleucine patch superfamily enzyme
MEDFLTSRIDGVINADRMTIGKGVVVEPGVLISGNDGPAEEVILGDFCYIGRESRILTPKFRLGDYSKLNAFCFSHGKEPLQIGRNCWFGGNVVLDSQGGLDIDDNVGVGAHSQLWTHIQFGDIVEGCRFFSCKYMYVGKDVWFVGHCIISPVNIGERSMALVGSVITHDMKPNRVYAGVPAVDVTDKFGPQFEECGVEQKARRLTELFNAFYSSMPQYRDRLKVVTTPDDFDDRFICFDVSTRTYTKRYDPAEYSFLRKYVPLVKFIPYGEPEFITPKKYK